MHYHQINIQYLEVANDLSNETFPLTFRRFASQKFLPQIVMSGNASTNHCAAVEFHNQRHLSHLWVLSGNSTLKKLLGLGVIERD